MAGPPRPSRHRDGHRPGRRLAPLGVALALALPAAVTTTAPGLAEPSRQVARARAVLAPTGTVRVRARATWLSGASGHQAPDGSFARRPGPPPPAAPPW